MSERVKGVAQKKVIPAIQRTNGLRSVYGKGGGDARACRIKATVAAVERRGGVPWRVKDETLCAVGGGLGSGQDDQREQLRGRGFQVPLRA
jgi:hypothetical protein